MTTDVPTSADHPAPALLERVAFEPDGAPGDDTSARSHAAACAACQTEIAAMRAAAARFVAARPAAAFASAIERRARAVGRRRMTSKGLAVLGSVAAAILLIAGPWRRPASNTVTRSAGPIVTERTKGGGPVDLRLFVSRHGEDAQPLDPASPLHAGEVLRFAVTVPADGHVVILDLDGTGSVSRYHPAGDPLPAGQERIQRGQTILPESIHLDDFVGDELVVLLFSPAAIDVERAATTLAEAFQATGGALDRVAGPNVAGTEVALVRIHKERR